MSHSSMFTSSYTPNKYIYSYSIFLIKLIAYEWFWTYKHSVLKYAELLDHHVQGTFYNPTKFLRYENRDKGIIIRSDIV